MGTQLAIHLLFDSIKPFVNFDKSHPGCVSRKSGIPGVQKNYPPSLTKSMSIGASRPRRAYFFWTEVFPALPIFDKFQDYKLDELPLVCRANQGYLMSGIFSIFCQIMNLVPEISSIHSIFFGKSSPSRLRHNEQNNLRRLRH